MPRRSAIVLIVLIALILAALGVRVWLSRWPGAAEAFSELFEAYPAGDRLVLKPAGFEGLPGWGEDALEEAGAGVRRSCPPLTAGPGDWQAACEAAPKVPPGDRAAARRFFETSFRPWSVRNQRIPVGLFTGYYEALLQGSRTRHGQYVVPLYGRPPELIMVDLGRFREALKGQRIAGVQVKGQLLPFPDRKAIDAGALAGRKLEIAWVKDPVGAFFLEVQGSGRIRMEDGRELRVGYAAQNGHPYNAIGRELIARHALDPKEVSLQTIRAWLEAH